MVSSSVVRPSPAASPVDVHRDVDGDLLAAADEHQVDVLDVAADRVALDVLGQRQLRAPPSISSAAGRWRLEREHRLVARQRDVHRVGAVAVEHGGDLVGAADPAGGTLAELGAGLGGELDLGHGTLLVGQRCGSGPRPGALHERTASITAPRRSGALAEATAPC